MIRARSISAALDSDGKKTRVTRQINMGPAAEFDEKTKAELRKNWTMMLTGFTKSAEED